MSNHQLTNQLLEGLEVAAKAAASPPDPKEAAEQFGQIIKDQLSRGN
jgi:hypothetical protein